MMDPGALDRLVGWVNEREAVRIRKDNLEHDPVTTHPAVTLTQQQAWGDRPAGYWQLDRLTNDPVLRQYRFCNVRREHDTVTRWIDEHIRQPYRNHPHLWLMLAIARTINWPPTLQNLMYAGAWPNTDWWQPKAMGDWLDKFKDRGDKVYTGAYMIRAESDPRKAWYSWTKQRYIAEVVIGRLWEKRQSFQDYLWNMPDGVHPSSEAVWETLQDFTGWGPFMAYQVVVDLQHTRYLRDAPDNQAWAAAGPGTLRGLNRLHGRAPTAPLRPEHAVQELVRLRGFLNALGSVGAWVTTPIDLSDVCNCCCEFDKYERVRLGEGRPRALYVPGRGF